MNTSVLGRWAAVVLLLAVLPACSAPGGESEAAATQEPSMSEPDSSPSSKSRSQKPSGSLAGGRQELTGSIGFDDIEGGCAYLESNGVRYEVIWPDGWHLERDSLQLIAPDGEVVARLGEQVTVRGSEATGMASICQIGPIFEATEVVFP
jgi:hypothetical protein